MKRNAFFVLGLMVLLIISCSKKDDPIIQFSLSTIVTPSEGGSVSPSTGTYVDGAGVSLTATPSKNYKFKNWSGGGTGTSNPVSIIMNGNKKITAVFEKNDDDGDGVSNELDQCDDTPDGTVVDSSGCAESQKDDDNDGVTNDVDQCEGTLNGATVDSNGCAENQKDDDSDGIMNDVDQCPNTLSGVTVNSIGCQTTYIPDDNFEQALIELGYDDILDDYVLTSNINTITFLQIRYKPIKDITGIEDFVSLTTLNLYSNEITSLDVSSLTSLSALTCAENELISLNASNNSSLFYINCSNNKLESINVEGATDLMELIASNNQLESVDVSDSFKLEELHLSNNLLTSLDINNNTALIKLFIDFNKLVTIDLSKNNSLTRFTCNDNQITSLDLSNITLLEVAKCHNNLLSCIKLRAQQIYERERDYTFNWTKDNNVVYSLDCN